MMHSGCAEPPLQRELSTVKLQLKLYSRRPEMQPLRNEFHGRQSCTADLLLLNRTASDVELTVAFQKR
jgi:hypothetical protein